MGLSLELTTTYESLTCYKASCGVVYALSSHYMSQRRRDHESFYCPNGHSQSYSGRSKEERLADELERQIKITQSVSNQRDLERSRKKSAQRRLSAQKGVTTKLRNRVAHGVCPCCARTFKQLQRHLENKHPEYLKKNKRKGK